MNLKLLLALSSLCVFSSQATDYNSIRDGSWFVATNTWDPANIPGNGDTVYISHHLYFDSTTAAQSVTVGNLNLNGAHLEIGGPATLTAEGANSMFSGSNFLSGVLYNQGTVFQSGEGTLAMPCSTHFENLGVGIYNLAGDGTILLRTVSGGSLPYFNNYGQLRKSSGVGIALFTDVYLNNLGGSIEVDAGTLVLGSGTSSNGTFTVAAGAVLDLTGGSSPTWAGVVGGSGAGTVLLASGILSASPSLTMDMSGNLFQWTGGRISGVTSNLNTITIAGANSRGIDGTFYNPGTIYHTNTSTIQIHASFYNLAGGTYDFQDGGTLSPYYGIFYNYGLLRKSAGTGTATISSDFDNNGGSNSGVRDNANATTKITTWMNLPFT